MRHFTSNGTDQCKKQFIKPPYSIQNDIDRLRLLSLTHGQRSFSARKQQIALQSLLTNKVQVLKATHHTEIRKMEIRGPWWWRPRAGEAGARVSIQPSKAPCIHERAPGILPFVVRDQLFPEISRFTPCILVSRRGFSRPTPCQENRASRPPVVGHGLTFEYDCSN